jgi:hypothetical protein
MQVRAAALSSVPVIPRRNSFFFSLKVANKKKSGADAGEARHRGSRKKPLLFLTNPLYANPLN